MLPILSLQWSINLDRPSAIWKTNAENTLKAGGVFIRFFTHDTPYKDSVVDTNFIVVAEDSNNKFLPNYFLESYHLKILLELALSLTTSTIIFPILMQWKLIL